jgi:hypothetical protein
MEDCCLFLENALMKYYTQFSITKEDLYVPLFMSMGSTCATNKRYLA